MDSSRSFRRRIAQPVLAIILALACFTGAARADILYTANATGGTFSTDAHYMQLITLNGPNVPFTINFFPVFGLRWHDVTQGNQLLFLTFWSNVNTDPSATNALAGAVNNGSIGFNIPAPGANGSYNYNLGSAANPFNISVPGNTFAVEVTMTNAAQSAYSTAIGARYSTSAAPSVGSAANFVWVDNASGNSNGAFSGSEQVGPAGTTGQTHMNIRMSIDATAVPEPGTNLLLMMGGGVGAMLLLRRARRRS